MSDARARSLERNTSEELAARVRSGELAREMLKLASLCGHPGAIECLGSCPGCTGHPSGKYIGTCVACGSVIVRIRKRYSLKQAWLIACVGIHGVPLHMAIAAASALISKSKSSYRPAVWWPNYPPTEAAVESATKVVRLAESWLLGDAGWEEVVDASYAVRSGVPWADLIFPVHAFKHAVYLLGHDKAIAAVRPALLAYALGEGSR